MKRRQKSKKPKKYSVWEFYFLAIGQKIMELLEGMGEYLLLSFGGWYCAHCKRLHGARIKRYRDRWFQVVCSLGKSESNQSKSGGM